MRLRNKRVFKISFSIFGLCLALFLTPGSVQAQSPGFSVSLEAKPSSGVGSLNQVDLKATVSGSTTGTINYIFYCNRSDAGTNITVDSDHRTASPTPDPYTVLDLCDYSSPGTYWAKVIVWVGTPESAAEARTRIDVSSAASTNNPPTCSISANPLIINTGESSIISGSASDPEGDPFTWAWGTSGGGRLSSFLGPPEKTYFAPADIASPSVLVTIAAAVTDNRGAGTMCNTQLTVKPAAPEETVGVNLSADPSAGRAPLDGVDLLPSVSGTASGTIKYYFDCNVTGSAGALVPSAGTWDYTLTSELANWRFQNACNYSSAGTHIAGVRVERQRVSAEDTVVITTSEPLPPPPPRTLSVTLEAVPDLGTPPINIVLKFTVSGTATGPIRYESNCSLELGGPWSLSFTTNENPKTISEPCGYILPGVYTAAVKVEREGVGPVQATAKIDLFGAEAAPSRVDIKANYSNDPPPITYNSSVLLTWGSLNIIAGSCRASGDWSGAKADNSPLGVGEVIGNLTSSQTFILTCQGKDRQDVSDSVTVTVEGAPPSIPPTLSVGLRALPNSGTAPLSNIALKATVSGTAIGTINYKFDCTNDGIWDYTYEHISDNPKTVTDACDYSDPGSYTAKVYVERDAVSPAQAMTVITVNPSSPPPPPPPPPGPPGIYRIPVLILKYFPTRDGINLDDRITGMPSQPLSAIRANTERLTNQLIQALGQGSQYHGYKDAASPSLKYEILKTTEFLEPIPTKGLRASHLKILAELNICDWVENRGIKEVWIWMYHTDQVVPVESYQRGPGHALGNGYMELPLCQKSYTVYDYNYARELGMALEDHAHHLEALFNYIDRELFWNAFVNPYGPGKGVTRCGWSHYPPNGRSDYDWTNRESVESICEDWHPDGSGQVKPISCSSWGDRSCPEDSGTSFKIWWMQNIPGKDNGLTYQGRAMRNWWEFVGDFDRTIEQRSLAPLAAAEVSWAPTDLNQDGQSDKADYRILLLSWGQSDFPGRYDLNPDGKIDGLDLELMKRTIQR